MKATVYYHPFTEPQTLMFGAPSAAYEEVWSGEVELEPGLGPQMHVDACETLFERFNIGDHGGKRIRSMSVGDKIVIDGRVFICKPTGFEELVTDQQ